MKKTIRNRFDLIVNNYISPKLKEKGFLKKRDTFFSLINDIRWVIEIQRSRWNNENEFQFTLNFGIYVPDLMEIFLNLNEPPKISIEHCSISCRIGMLMNNKKDKWWKLTNNDTLSGSQKAIEIIEMIETFGIPFLSRFKDQVTVAEFLSSKRKIEEKQIAPQSEAYCMIYAAIIYFLTGAINQSNICTEEAIKMSKGSSSGDIIEEIAMRLFNLHLR